MSGEVPDNEFITVYHGSPLDLTVIAKDQCVCATPDYPQLFAQGKVPGSVNHGLPEGWIYELRVRRSQIIKRGLDTLLLEEVAPIRRFPASAYKRKSVSELLGDAW